MKGASTKMTTPTRTKKTPIGKVTMPSIPMADERHGFWIRFPRDRLDLRFNRVSHGSQEADADNHHGKREYNPRQGAVEGIDETAEESP